jgi:TonB family protein
MIMRLACLVGLILAPLGPGPLGDEADVELEGVVDTLVVNDDELQGSPVPKCIEGIVIVQFTILEDGTTTDFSVLEAEPPKILDELAIKMAEQLRFTPVVEDGVPIVVRGVVESFTFTKNEEMCPDE